MPKINFFEFMDKEMPLIYSSLKAKGRGGEKRAVLEVCLKLNGKSIQFTRLPKTFGSTLASMQENEDITETKVDHTANNMAIDFYGTPDSAKPILTAHAATIDGFELIREKIKVNKKTGQRKGPAADVYLWFNVSFDVRNDKQAKLFAWDYLGNHFWWKAEPGQKELLPEDAPIAGEETNKKPANEWKN